ncbi:PP2C-like domain-containing protein CG9801 [Antedon mediterranea]|uniref:PP2C-like domain-containing protein CG9801 n=1 Tax=Antedon mediterranea TaxID=105859 RepID=UPI003AF5E8B3
MTNVFDRRASATSNARSSPKLVSSHENGRMRRSQSVGYRNFAQNRFSKLVRKLSVITFSPAVLSHRGSFLNLPFYDTHALSPNIFATYSGPEGGLTNAPCDPTNESALNTRKTDWDIHHRRAYGTAVSLYERNPKERCRTGNPVADVFAIQATENGAILVLADGVGWGPKSRLAAQCAVRGCTEYLQAQLFGTCPPKNTHEVFKLLRTSLDHGQRLILISESTLTTICIAVVVQLQRCDQYVVCVVNVGDSLAYVYSHKHGVREITTGCRDLQHDRDLRECGGALGPAVGEEADLDNLTFSLTMSEQDDVVFLTSDGIADNFDPAIALTARICDFKFKKPKDSLPLIQTAERHPLSINSMTKLLEKSAEYEPGEDTAMQVCEVFIQYVVKLTNDYRDNLESYHKAVNNNDLTNEQREKLQALRKETIYNLPGKLDHASIVALTVGHWKHKEGAVVNGQEMEVYPP